MGITNDKLTDKPPIKILADATLPNLIDLFKTPFQLTLYENINQCLMQLPHHQVLICRSTLPINANLLNNIQLDCVATASSGIDHIDLNYLKNQNISLYDAKGSNATAVADYVMATLAFLLQTKQLKGKRAGVIGIGEVGTRVVNRLRDLGFEVLCFDPLRAKDDHDYSYCQFNELINCDLLCVHCNLHETQPFPSKDLLDATFLNQLTAGTCIINAARGGIVNEQDLLNTKNSIVYCTDVYCNEPDINPNIVKFATLCTPHIAGHSIEAKQAAIIMMSEQLHRHYGLIMPSVDLLTVQNTSQTETSEWCEYILNLYHPLNETIILKKSDNKKTAFIEQRQAHKNRHDFNWHDIRLLI